MFARKRQVDPLEPAPEGELSQPVITGPAAKLMSMLGLSPEVLQQTGDQVKALVEDFQARLDRIEAKLDFMMTENEKKHFATHYAASLKLRENGHDRAA